MALLARLSKSPTDSLPALVPSLMNSRRSFSSFLNIPMPSSCGWQSLQAPASWMLKCSKNIVMLCFVSVSTWKNVFWLKKHFLKKCFLKMFFEKRSYHGGAPKCWSFVTPDIRRRWWDITMTIAPTASTSNHRRHATPHCNLGEALLQWTVAEFCDPRRILNEPRGCGTVCHHNFTVAIAFSRPVRTDVD